MRAEESRLGQHHHTRLCDLTGTVPVSLLDGLLWPANYGRIDGLTPSARAAFYALWISTRLAVLPRLSGLTIIPIKDDTVAATESRIKRKIGYILCKVHVWKWPVAKYKHIKIKPRICVLLIILCLTWTVNANSLKQNIIVIKEICSWLPPWLVQ